MRILCNCKYSQCGVIALMSFFIMGFQFTPSGLLHKDQKALSDYAAGVSVKEQTMASVAKGVSERTTIDLPWLSIKFSLPKVDFGLDGLYGLDKEAHDDTFMDDLRF